MAFHKMSKLHSVLAKERQEVMSLKTNKACMQSTIDNLRAELLKYRHITTSNSLTVATITPPVSLFMKKLPTEIRLKIYKMLLVNPQLGQAWWIGNNTNYGASFQYELSPSILRVSHTIYDEAFPVLYGSNTFIFVCHRRDTNWVTNLPQCPLTRYLDPGSYPKTHRGDTKNMVNFNFDQLAGIKAVRYWNIITADIPGSGLSKTFVRLCQALCNSHIRTMTLSLILSKSTMGSSDGTQITRANEQLRTVGEVLQVLGEVEDLNFIVAQPNDLPVGLFHAADQWYPFESCFGEHIRDKYMDIVENSPPSERIFLMNRHLLSYAQSFERNDLYKAEMDPDYTSPSEINHQRNTLLTENLFKILGETDTVESNLEAAVHCSDRQDDEGFKAARKSVVELLDPQYRQISAAMSNLRKHIIQQKSVFGIFDQYLGDHEEHELICEKSLELLEEAAKCFERDLSPKMRLQIRKFPTRYCLKYDYLPREKWLARMATLFIRSPDEALEITNFVELFKLVSDDMQAQYLKITKARKDLLKADFADDPGLDLPEDRSIDQTPFDWTIDSSMFEDNDL